MVSTTLRTISNDKSLVLFNTIALSSGNTDIIISKLNFTRKQYYSRMAAFGSVGLITRRRGRYLLTSFGKVVYETQMLIGKAKQNYWKLKAIDSIESVSEGWNFEERSKIVHSLIEDEDLKRILLRRNRDKAVEKDLNQKLIAPRQY